MSFQETPFPDEIRRQYPQLSLQESVMCWLLWAGYKKKVIAQIIEIPHQRISNKIKEIRRKIGKTPS